MDSKFKLNNPAPAPATSAVELGAHSLLNKLKQLASVIDKLKDNEMSVRQQLTNTCDQLSTEVCQLENALHGIENCFNMMETIK